ncbi:hypothetical protein HXT42_01315 [Gardnerella sp. DNF01192]|uniref:hypothetical protein n=1 Tax=Gardnerella sp. DNF01192 TaxID=2749064 RepID=UPI000EE278AB|nr:hypothetical protein CG399_05090 [Bifidobacteriaceae bacterium NR015]
MSKSNASSMNASKMGALNMNSSSVNNSSHSKLLVVLTSAAVIVVLALISAFMWPGWALNHENVASKNHMVMPKTPSIPSKPLPASSTSLLKAMPDSVLDFARVDAIPSANWTESSPLEEYSVKYSTGQPDGEVSVTVAQWSNRDSANKQYEALVDGLKGSDIASGKIQVSGKTYGSYVLRNDENDKSQASALWQNDTAVFEVKGAKQAVERFYHKFPM